MTTNNIDIKRGDVCLVDLGEGIGSEQCGIRPVIIIQNNAGNAFSPTTIVCPLTTKLKKEMPTHVKIESGNCVEKTSIALLEQIRVIDKNRLIKKVGTITNQNLLSEINRKILISFGL